MGVHARVQIRHPGNRVLSQAQHHQGQVAGEKRQLEGALEDWAAEQRAEEGETG